MRNELHVAALRRIETYRSRDLSTHETNVSRVCGVLCETLGVDSHFAGQLKTASELHDIGKLAISDALLDKPAKLTTDELAVMNTHSRIGYEILSGSGDPVLDLAASVALCHHECFDGSGYPRGLQGDVIPFASRVVSLCDVYDALRADRPYRCGMTHQQSVSVITAHEGRASYVKFDPILLNAFANRSADIANLYN